MQDPLPDVLPSTEPRSYLGWVSSHPVSGSLAPKSDRVALEAVFLESLGFIERVAASLCRRYAVESDAASDVTSWIKMRLIENDYAIMAKFRGESSITTYLTVVITMLFRDYRVQHWGRWRPSAAAQREGAVAIRLETLVYRDGFTLDQAAERMRTSRETDLSSRDLSRLFSRLPVRQPLRPKDAGAQPLILAPATGSADDRVRDDEASAQRRSVETALQASLAALPAEDAVILRMHYWDGLGIAEISRALGLPQKPLYRRLERLLAQLRDRLESLGISSDAARGLLLDEITP